LDAFEEYLHSNDVYPPLVRLALIHYQFEAIHPFIDGNGRVGRLLTSLLLVEWELLPLPLLYLSAFFYRHRQDYYDLLTAVSERGDWEAWISFFLQGVTEQARDAIMRARQLQDLQEKWHERLTEARASALLLQLADHLFDTPVITIPEAQRLLDVTYRSAKLNVDKLINAGILDQIGEADYGKTFVASEILEVVGTNTG
jgi:Fic family protein